MLLITILLSWALSAQASTNFCVQTFNAYGPFYAPETETRTLVLANELKNNGLCDFLFLQEMWNNNHYTYFNELMQTDFGATSRVLRADDLRLDGDKSGLVVAAKPKIENPMSFVFNINKVGAADEIREQLGVKKGVLTFDATLFDHKVHLMNSHLHQSSEPVRLAQLIQIHQALSTSNGYQLPWVFTGDFNFQPGSLEWQFLTQVMGFRDAFDEVATDKNACTYCADNMLAWDSDSRRIDFVMYRSTDSFKFKPVAAQIVFKGDPDFPLSDHYGIKIDFSFGEQTPAPQTSPAKVRSILEQSIESFEFDGRSEFLTYIDYLRALLKSTK